MPPHFSQIRPCSSRRMRASMTSAAARSRSVRAATSSASALSAALAALAARARSGEQEKRPVLAPMAESARLGSLGLLFVGIRIARFHLSGTEGYGYEVVLIHRH